MEFSFLYSTNSGRLTVLTLLLSLYFIENARYQASVLLLSIPTLAVLYAFNKHYSYWDNAGIPCIRESFPFGYFRDIVFHRASLSEILLDLYAKCGDNKYIGIYSFLEPQIFIKDLDLIKSILVKDFSNFIDRGVHVNTELDKLTGNMFSLGGQPWKNLRAKISPAFSIGKLKTMYSNVKQIAKNFTDYTADLQTTQDVINVKEIVGRYNLDVISSVALGLEGNNFKDEFTHMRRFADSFTAPSRVQMYRSSVSLLSRDLAKVLRMRMTSKEVEDYFFRVTRDTIKYRRENNVTRMDFMHLLMNLAQENNQSNGTHENENNKDQVCLTLSEMAAQSFSFVVAGYETSSTTFGFLLYELALNPALQDRLIEELDSAGPDLQYDELMKLPYLDMALNETLRKHPSLPILSRECINDYKMPGGKIIKAGTICLIPVIGLQRDPELFPDPKKFDPERFSTENMKNIKPYSFIPFGEGPRSCIGSRFAVLQLKVALVEFFSKFRVEMSEKTPLKINLNPSTFLYTSEGGLWLRLIDRKT